jgi:hypothetical protein
LLFWINTTNCSAISSDNTSRPNGNSKCRITLLRKAVLPQPVGLNHRAFQGPRYDVQANALSRLRDSFFTRFRAPLHCCAPDNSLKRSRPHCRKAEYSVTSGV